MTKITSKNIKKGDKINSLTFMNLEGKSSNGVYIALLSCDCGAEVKTRISRFLNGETKACRSCSAKANSEKTRQRNKENALKSFPIGTQVNNLKFIGFPDQIKIKRKARCLYGEFECKCGDIGQYEISAVKCGRVCACRKCGYSNTIPKMHKALFNARKERIEKIKNNGRKKCCKCKKFKFLTQFTIRNRGGLGLSSRCKECDSVDRKPYIKMKSMAICIRDEVMNIPSRGTKHLWDGVGDWCKKYPEIDRCVECNCTTYVHIASGVCSHCYNRLISKKKTAYTKKHSDAKKEYSEELKKYLKRAQEGEFDDNPKIKNIVKNINNLKQS